MGLTLHNTFSLTVFFLLGCHLASQAMARTLHEADLIDAHEKWMAQHGRTYASNDEKEIRFKIFKENLQYVEKFNKEAKETYKLSLNQFADYTNEEFLSNFTSYGMPVRTRSSREYESFMYENLTDVPTTVDWRDQGAVTAVKNQNQCGCCWAFSAVAAVEGITKIKTGSLVSLSEQQLVDCVTSNHGCSGGLMVNAFEYIIQNQGITTETDYPYQGTDIYGCQASESSAVQISGYEEVPSNNEAAILKAVSAQPVSVAIVGSGRDFKFYRGGVFTGGDCGSIEPNHAVTIVGYGTTEDGIKYWLLKNSWGESWGEDGYMKLMRDVESPEGLCGVATHASYPVA